jgi:hypothetical protein
MPQNQTARDPNLELERLQSRRETARSRSESPLQEHGQQALLRQQNFHLYVHARFHHQILDYHCKSLNA